MFEFLEAGIAIRANGIQEVVDQLRETSAELNQIPDNVDIAVNAMVDTDFSELSQELQTEIRNIEEQTIRIQVAAETGDIDEFVAAIQEAEEVLSTFDIDVSGLSELREQAESAQALADFAEEQAIQEERKAATSAIFRDLQNEILGQLDEERDKLDDITARQRALNDEKQRAKDTIEETLQLLDEQESVLEELGGKTGVELDEDSSATAERFTEILREQCATIVETKEKNTDANEQLSSENEGLIEQALELLGIRGQDAQRIREVISQTGILNGRTGQLLTTFRGFVAANARVLGIAGLIAVAYIGIKTVADEIADALLRQLEIQREINNEAQQLQNSQGLSDEGSVALRARLEALTEASQLSQDAIRGAFEEFRNLDSLRGAEPEFFFQVFENAVSLTRQTGQELNEVIQIIENAQNGLDGSELLNLQQNFNQVFQQLESNADAAGVSLEEFISRGSDGFRELTRAIDEVSNGLSDDFDAEFNLRLNEQLFIGQFGTLLNNALRTAEGFLGNTLARILTFGASDAFDEVDDYVSDRITRIRLQLFSLVSGQDFDQLLNQNFDLNISNAQERIEELEEQLRGIPRLLDDQGFQNQFILATEDSGRQDLIDEMRLLREQIRSNRERADQLAARATQPNRGRRIAQNVATGNTGAAVADALAWWLL